jgi:hypothetical protein
MSFMNVLCIVFSKKFCGPFLFLFVIYLLFILSVLVKKTTPVDLDVPLNFLLPHISDEERHGRCFFIE